MPILTPTIWIVIVSAALQCTTSFGWWITRQNLETASAKLELCRQERQQFESSIRAAGELAQSRALIEQKKSEEVTRKASHEHKANLDALRADYDRLRKRSAVRSGSREVQSFPVAAASVDEVPSNCLPLAEQSAETTLMLVDLQAWIEQQKDTHD